MRALSGAPETPAGGRRAACPPGPESRVGSRGRILELEHEIPVETALKAPLSPPAHRCEVRICMTYKWLHCYGPTPPVAPHPATRSRRAQHRGNRGISAALDTFLSTSLKRQIPRLPRSPYRETGSPKPGHIVFACLPRCASQACMG